MAGNIIPAIATTNAMTAGLCALQAFKVLQNNLANAMVRPELNASKLANSHKAMRQVFLERSGARAINSEPLNPPRTDCAVCSATTGHVIVDPKSTTLYDIVQGILRSELEYGEELSILKDLDVIYDPDLDDNLSNKLSEFGITNHSSIIVVDEDDQDQDPRVNLELFIIER